MTLSPPSRFSYRGPAFKQAPGQEIPKSETSFVLAAYMGGLFAKIMMKTVEYPADSDHIAQNARLYGLPSADGQIKQHFLHLDQITPDRMACPSAIPFPPVLGSDVPIAKLIKAGVFNSLLLLDSS